MRLSDSDKIIISVIAVLIVALLIFTAKVAAVPGSAFKVTDWAIFITLVIPVLLAIASRYWLGWFKTRY